MRKRDAGAPPLSQLFENRNLPVTACMTDYYRSIALEELRLLTQPIAGDEPELISG